MKTFRMSDSAENRNARRAINYRGGARRTGATIPQEQQIVSGRRLRRAARSGKGRIETFMIQDDGTLRHLPANVDIDPQPRAFHCWRDGNGPESTYGLPADANLDTAQRRIREVMQREVRLSSLT